MGFLKEFKEFALRGNLVDMAVAVIVAGGFQKVVSSFIDGICMPPLGKLMGNMNFSELYISLSSKVTAAQQFNGGNLSLEEAKKLGPVMAYGNFITNLIDFILVAFVVFMFIKMMNRLHHKDKKEPEVKEPSKEEQLLTEIRDLLKNK